MTTPLILSLPNFTKGFKIECDASGSGIGAVLMQCEKSIAFLNQVIKDKNLSLSTYDELFALVVVVKKWIPYLISNTFVLRTDHHSLKYLLEKKVGTPSQRKWISKLLGYEFSIEVKSSHTNNVVDALSKCGAKNDPIELAVISFPALVWL